eukprot:372091-Rhodomonas_salina.2
MALLPADPEGQHLSTLNQARRLWFPVWGSPQSGSDGCAELHNFKCKVCTLCKGARVYKHTKHVQEKMESKKQAKASKNWEQVLLETDLNNVEEEDELLQAFQDEEFHMDYAHSIPLGYNNEQYYLLKEPEILLLEFLSDTGLKIGKVRRNNEFTASSTFQAFCKKRDIALCPSVAYTHTMQARAEGPC